MKLTGGRVAFSGILKIVYDEKVIIDIQKKYSTPDNLVPIPSKNIHITLCHQKVVQSARLPKLMVDTIAKHDFAKIEVPAIELESYTKVIEADGKRSAFVRVMPKYWDILKGMTNSILAEYGLRPYLFVREFEREHHISLANRTGKPGDSIAFTWRHDPENKHLEWPYDIEPCASVLDKDLTASIVV